jgi:anti-anti-sigma factor
MDQLEDQPDLLISFDVAVDGDQHATVTIAGELDMSGIEPLAARVQGALDGGVTRLTVDVGAVRFADSSALALWVRWASVARQFELRDPPPLLRRVIAAMGLNEKLGVAS